MCNVTRKKHQRISNCEIIILWSCFSSAVASLEVSGLTNAGAGGAQLNAAGNVELDASLIACNSAQRLARTAAVASVPNVRSPMRLVQTMFDHAHGATSPHLSLGRVRPTMLCGENARLWAEMHCPDALGAFERNGDRVEQWNDCRALWKRSDINAMLDPVLPFVSNDGVVNERSKRSRQTSQINDTVGAVCFLRNRDGQCSVSAAVSSGGLLFKTPGRVGEAAIPGAGAWCCGADDGMYRAASVSGIGEGVMQTQLARLFCDSIDCALESHRPTVCDADAGVLAVYSGESFADVRAVFNTRSFGFGCTSSGDSRLHVEMQRQLNDKVVAEVRLRRRL